MLQLRLGRLFPGGTVRPQGLDHTLEGRLELVVVLPFDEVRDLPFSQYAGFAADGVREHIVVQANRNQGELLRPLLHQPAFFLEGLFQLFVHPPGCQRRLRTTEEDLVPELDAPVYPSIDVITGKKLVLVEPAADPLALELVVKPSCEGLVHVAVTDEAGVELDWLPDEGAKVGDIALGQAATAEEGFDGALVAWEVGEVLGGEVQVLVETRLGH